ncbi:glycosyltransferase family 4 protein [Marinithermofilum abyssi]|nr:glycosyltransferase family 4 protein [Marinithermofilum abyssi]
MSLQVLVISHMYPNPANPMSGIFVHNQVKALKGEGIQCRVVSPIPRFPFYPKWKGYRNFPASTKMDNISIRYVPTWMFPGGMFFSAYGRLYYNSLVKEITEIRKSFPFDLIHCHTIFPDGYAGTKLKEVFDVPVVSTIHGSDIRLYPQRSKGVYIRTETALRLNDHVVTVSERLKRDAQEIVAGVEATTIYNGYDPDKFYPTSREEARTKLDLPLKEKVVLFVGNLYPVKGVPYLLEAFARVAKEDPDFHLYLVGDGPLRSELKRKARETGVGDRIRFIGRRPHDEIPVWINASNVVTLSSLSEGLPSILLESMGCGKPVVATDVGGISELLQHQKTGFLVKPKDSEEMAHYLGIILRNENGIARDMGERAYIESGSLTWQQNAKRMRKLYEEVVGKVKSKLKKI